MAVLLHPAGVELDVDSTDGDTATNAVVATIAVDESPVGVAVNPAGTRVYVTNSWSDTVSVIDTAGLDRMELGAFLGVPTAANG